MSRAAFLQAILAAPDNDTSRMVFADWLDDRGDADQAEFIRVQCEVEGWRKICVNHDTHRLNCPGCALRRRERELLDVAGFGWAGAGISWVGVRTAHDPILTQYGAVAVFRRGFVEEVACTAADWLAHGDAIRRAQPVWRVRLTTWPQVDLGVNDEAKLEFWFVSRSEAQITVDVTTLDRMMTVTEAARLIFKTWQSGIEFDFPSPASLTELAAR